MKKKWFLLIPLLLLSGCVEGTSLTGAYAEPTSKTPGSSDFDFDGNLMTGDLKIDGRLDDDAWKDPGLLKINYGENDRVTFRAYWGEKGLTVSFVCLDQFISASTNYGDELFVVNSDNVEFYIDTKHDGGSGPQPDDYEFLVNPEGYAMLQVGGGKWWGPWSGVVDYAVSVDGTINDDSDADVSWTTELFLPYATFGFTEDSTVGIALGARNKTTNLPTSDWYGWTPDPQVPDTYVAITKAGIKMEEVEGYSVRAGKWSYADGVYVSQSTNSLISKNDASFKEGTLSVKMTMPSYADNGIVFALSNTSSLFWESGVSYYFFFVNRDGNALLGRVKNGAWSSLVTSDHLEDFALNRETALKVAVSGATITGYVDGVAVISDTERNYLTGVSVGLRAGGDGVRFTDLIIENN